MIYIPKHCTVRHRTTQHRMDLLKSAAVSFALGVALVGCSDPEVSGKAQAANAENTAKENSAKQPVNIVLSGDVNLQLSGNVATQLAAIADNSKPTAQTPSKSKVFFEFVGNKVKRPTGYREWVYVGTPVTPNELNPPEASFPEFHNVYIDPVSWAYFKKTGKFRDGTILVKELVTVGSKVAVSGNGYFMGKYRGLEATIKSSKHFPNEPGNWAYFSWGHSYPLADMTEPFPKESCNSCHEASAAKDFVFMQYYPVLAAADPDRKKKAENTLAPEFREKLMNAMAQSTAKIDDATAPAGKSSGPVPTDNAKLFAYLSSGEYKKLAVKETKVHPSQGPHTKAGFPVRVFMDKRVAASLKAGEKSHPVGSSIVKEMYNKDGTKLKGWAVMVKTQDDSDHGRGWFWYEIASTAAGAKPVASGNGITICSGCHSLGKDFVRSHQPLE